jgi:hypothetical protein
MKNPVLIGTLGVYHGMLLIESPYLLFPRKNVCRAVLMGKQALSFGMANPYDAIERKKMGKNNMMSWAKRTDDYGNIKGVCGGMVLGMIKNTFDGVDHGTMVISSYAAQHKG